MKVMLGVLLSHGFPVPAPFVISYSLMQQTLLQGVANATYPDVTVDTVRVLFGQDFPIDHARNRLCRLFLDESDFDYLLFLDTDMTHPPDIVHQLLSYDVDIVSGRYTMRKPPFFTVGMRKTGPGGTDYQAIEKLVPTADIRGLMPIDGGGAGALMISRRCLLVMRQLFKARAQTRAAVLAEAVKATGPDFRFAANLAAMADEPLAEHVSDDWFRYTDGADGLRSRSEDMWFYQQALVAGFQPYLAADVTCGHIAQFEVDHTFHAPYAEAFKKALPSPMEQLQGVLK